MFLFSSLADFITQFEFYTKLRFKNLSLSALGSNQLFVNWLEKNSPLLPFVDIERSTNTPSGASAVVLLTDSTAMKFFVPDSEKGDPSTVLNSDDYLRTIYILRSDLYNALVIETILRTATLGERYRRRIILFAEE
jgi:hypothetical protein